MSRKSYSTDVTDKEWDFARLYLALFTAEALLEKRSINKTIAGCNLVVLKRELRIYVPLFVWLKEKKVSPA